MIERARARVGQKNVLSDLPDASQVVVATNIAETSLTIDGIKYVIDCDKPASRLSS